MEDGGLESVDKWVGHSWIILGRVIVEGGRLERVDWVLIDWVYIDGLRYYRVLCRHDAFAV